MTGRNYVIEWNLKDRKENHTMLYSRESTILCESKYNSWHEYAFQRRHILVDIT